MPRRDPTDRTPEERARLLALGAAIRARRNDLGWSLKAVEERGGGNASYIAEVENGKRDPQLSWLDRLATALNTTTARLLAARDQVLADQ